VNAQGFSIRMSITRIERSSNSVLVLFVLFVSFVVALAELGSRCPEWRTTTVVGRSQVTFHLKTARSLAPMHRRVRHDRCVFAPRSTRRARRCQRPKRLMPSPSLVTLKFIHNPIFTEPISCSSAVGAHERPRFFAQDVHYANRALAEFLLRALRVLRVCSN
jgi:hypothetical protein